MLCASHTHVVESLLNGVSGQFLLVELSVTNNNQPFLPGSSVYQSNFSIRNRATPISALTNVDLVELLATQVFLRSTGPQPVLKSVTLVFVPQVKCLFKQQIHGALKLESV